MPLDAYGAFGHGGIRAMIPIPSLELIVSCNATKTRGREMENRALKLLVEACRTRPKKARRTSICFPLPGESLANQDRRTLDAVQ